MKLSQGKIKDFVEPQAYDEVHDFAADPARALAAYCFTDATSDLLARWLDALADLPRGHGAGRALAGLRGVGKSHTLAAFAALVSQPTLRATVSDAHVATSARRLTNRRYAVVRAERGTRATLGEELATAFTKAFGGHPAEWAGDAAAALSRAVARAGGSTLVLVVDTAYGRASRVSRDDGAALGALAEAARGLDAFVALALDDDIAGAEGPNVALSRAFPIDYLEPEHLYQIAGSFLLKKPAGARERLHEIYLALRHTVPNFNWSEPRFAALYPVHPVVAEVASSVRLHAHSFAFLPFAAQAAQRATGRPALSLVLLDEVFDHTEKELRAAKELREAFAAYDELSANGVAQFPALQRLQVRLVLKNLFVLSLDGRGATARDLVAAMLMHGESAEQGTGVRVEEILRRLAEVAPPGSLALGGDDEETCYRFAVGSNGGFDAALAKAVKLPLSDAQAVSRLLASFARARFADYPHAPGAKDDAHGPPGGDVNGDVPDRFDFSVVWRGSTRAGRVFAHAGGDAPLPESSGAHEWELFVVGPGADGSRLAQNLTARRAAAGGEDAAPVAVVWQPAELTAEEYGLLRRLHALRNDPSLAGFGEAARVAAKTLASRAERVWTRLYVDEGALVIDGERFRFTSAARSAPTFAAVFAEVLAPLFAARHPQHPHFAAPLCEQDVARLVEEFFSGANATDAAVQRLAEEFALPLGLAAARGNSYAHASCDEAARSPWVASLLALVESAGNQVVPVAEAQRALARPPFGLGRDALHLVSAALVACGRAELTTTAGGLITRRTLGRAVNWEEIAGVRRAADAQLGAAELTEWAQRLTERADLSQLIDPSARAAALAALSAWLEAWRADNPLARFDELPDSGLTTRAARLAAAVRATYGAAADAVESALAGGATPEDAAQQVAECFASSVEEFARASARLAELDAYIGGVARRESARDYLVMAEPTGVEEIESARRELLKLAQDPHTLFDADSRSRFELLWRAFCDRYAAHYAEAHERACGPARDRSALDALVRSSSWCEFESLARLPFADPRPWREASRLAERARGASCPVNVAELLAEQPRCACRFRLADVDEQDELISRLADLADRTRAAYRRDLARHHAHLAGALASVAAEETRAEVGARTRALANSFARGENPPHVSAADASLILRALEHSPAPPPLVRVAPPRIEGLLAREEVVARLAQWLEELPAAQSFVEITGENHTHAAADTAS